MHRTCNLLITKQVLDRLSYRSTWGTRTQESYLRPLPMPDSATVSLGLRGQCADMGALCL